MSPTPRKATPRKPRLLQVEELKTDFHTFEGLLDAVDGVTFSVYSVDATSGSIGESGCGKSVTALSVICTDRASWAAIDGGSVRWRTRNDPRLAAKAGGGADAAPKVVEFVIDLAALKPGLSGPGDDPGYQIATVLQEPMTCFFSPDYIIGNQIREAILIYTCRSGTRRPGPRRRRAPSRCWPCVAIPNPKKTLRR